MRECNNSNLEGVDNMSKMLKIQFWKAENALAMQILKQEGLPSCKEEGFALIEEQPALCEYSIDLRGHAKWANLRIPYIEFNNNTERDEYLQKAVNAITEELFSGEGKLKIGEMCEVSSESDFKNVMKLKLIHILPEGYDKRYLADLSYASMLGATLTHANLKKAFLYHADLSWSNLHDANLEDATLSDANLYAANLCDAKLQCADLRDADLRFANLNYANLYHAQLEDALLKGADLSEAKTNDRILCLDRIGSANRRTTYNVTKDIVWCGCFTGTFKEWISRIRKTYPDKNSICRKEYEAAIAYFRAIAKV